jgi:hypothetical protein
MWKRRRRLAQTARIGGEGGDAHGFQQMVRRPGAQDDDMVGVRLVASSRSGEWERERMGAQLDAWKRKKGGGGLAAGKTRPAEAGGVGWAATGVGARWGGDPDTKKLGRRRSH